MRYLVVVCLVLSCSAMLHAQIYSTLAGGNWDDTQTWIGNVVPGIGDDVVVQGPVMVNAAFTCHDLTVTASGEVRNRSNYNYSLTVYGDVMNDGIIANNTGWSFSLYTHGDVTNNGTFGMNTLDLALDSDQTLFMGGAAVWEPGQMTSGGGTGQVYLDSDATFTIANSWSAGGHTVNLQGHDLTLACQYLDAANIQGTGSETVTMTAGYSQASTFTDVHLGGTFLFGSGITLNTVVNDGSICNRSNYHYTIDVYGDFVNNGTMSSYAGSYNLRVNAYDDVQNNGTWNINTFRLNGGAVQTLSQAPGTSFMAYEIECNNTGGIALGSNLQLETSYMNIELHTIALNGHDFSFSGRLYEAFVEGCGSETVYGLDGSTLHTTELHDVTLDGVHTMFGANHLYNVTNEGTITNYPNNHYTTTLYDGFVNNGAVQNNAVGYTLNIYAYGDVTNNGVWQVRYFNLTGTDMYTLRQAEGCVFEQQQLSILNDGGLALGSDVALLGTYVNANEHSIVLNGNNLRYSGRLYEADVIGSGYEVVYADSTSYDQSNTLQEVVLDGVHTMASGNTLYQVTNNGIMQNYPNTNYSVVAQGDFVNNGALRNNPGGYSFYFYPYQNVVSNGMWDIYRIELHGTQPQTFTSLNGEPFNVTYVHCHNTTGMVAGSNLTFVGTYFDFNSAPLDLTGGYTLDVDADLYEISVLGANQATMIGHGGALSSFNASNVTLGGHFKVGSSVTMTNVVNLGILENYPNSSYSLGLQGSFVNHGTVRNNPTNYTLSVRSSGDIVHDGVWNVYTLNLNGTAAQTITAPDSAFVLNSMADEDATSPVLAGSNLHFVNTNIDMNGGTLDLGSAGPQGYHLTMDGGTLREMSLAGGPGSQLVNLATTSLITAAVHDVTLYGTVNCYDGVAFYNLTNEGTVQNGTNGSRNVHMYGTTVNNGTMTNNPVNYTFSASVHDDFTHAGTISMYQINLEGDAPQTLHTAPGAVYELVQMSSTNTADTLWLDGPTQFVGAQIDLNGDWVGTTDGSNITLCGGYLREAVIEGNGELTLTGGAKLNTVTANGFTHRGLTYVEGDVVLKNATLMDTLCNANTGGYRVDLDGDCVNYGVIETGLYTFYIDMMGNFHNYGTVNVDRIDVNGTVEQTIIFEHYAPINSETRLYSDIGSALWYMNGVTMGTTSTFITLAAIDLSTFGHYNAFVDPTWSRDIHLLVMPQQPQNLWASGSDAGISLTWNESIGALHYVLQVANAPEGPFVVLEASITDPTPGDGTVSWLVASPGAERRYYRVMAAN